MTLNHNSKAESALNAKISELLMLLEREYGMTNRTLAEVLGVNENHISRVKTGKVKSSTQFLAALKLLVRVIELEQKRALEEEAQRIQKRILELEKARGTDSGMLKKIAELEKETDFDFEKLKWSMADISVAQKLADAAKSKGKGGK